MTLYKIIIFAFLFALTAPIGYAGGISSGNELIAPPPVEKVKPPVEKGKKTKKKKRTKKLHRQKKKLKAPEDLSNRALTFWLVFVIAAILLAIFSAFLIWLGFGLAWSVAMYIMLGSEIAAFLVIMGVLWIDRPGDAYVKFIFALIGLIIINILMGISFLIWGLVISWMFGWIIGLILLGLALIFFGLHLILSHFNQKS
jgi:hypothetical protein